MPSIKFYKSFKTFFMVNDTEIRNLFETRYEIDPMLQRSYEWDVNRAINLIKDIRDVKLTKNDGGRCRYNIGDFITYSNDDDSINSIKYLCDGQQRLTTLVLLLANILHHEPSDPQLRGGIVYYLKKSSINSDGREEKVNVLKLKGTDDEILKKIIENGTLKLSTEEKESHLIKVYNKITEEFTKNMNSDELSDFYTSIIKNASYFERKCESKEEAIKQFNNLNGGQQSITPTRKGIAQLYGWYNEERCNKERYNKDIERFLFELSNMPEKDLKGRKSSMDFLCLYLYYRGKAEYRESNIAKELADLKKQDDNLLEHISDFYFQIWDKNIKNRKEHFSGKSSLRQAWVDLYTDKYPSMKDIDTSEKNKAYKKYEWGYINNLIKKGGSGGKNLFRGYLKDFVPDCGQLSTYVESKLKDNGLFEPIDIIDSYERDNKKGCGIYPKLLQIVEEQYQIDLGCKEAINHVCEPTLEHIHPKNPRKDKEYDCDDSFTYNFGNMTIIGGKANSSLSNDVFEEKNKVYKKSPYYINSHHLAKYDHWDGETVNNNKMFYFDELKKYYGL